MGSSVAVIIPTFNRMHCLARALDSVLCQTIVADEIILVDDGSADGTDDFVKKNYPDVNYIFQKNKGVSAARNFGVSNSSSDFLAFLDSDDQWMPVKLEQQLSVLSQYPKIQLVHTQEQWIRKGVRVNQMNKHQKSGGYIFEKCLPLCAISPSSVLMSRELFDTSEGFDEDLPACEDYDLWLRICCKYPVHFIEQALIKKYGGHEDQLSKAHWGMDRFRVKALEKLLESGSLSDEQFEQARDMLLKKCEILINGGLKRGNADLVAQHSQLVQRYGNGEA